MDYATFTRTTAERAGVPEETAERIEHATLQTLADRISGGEAQDLDTSPQTSQRFAVRAVPTLMVLRNGQVLARQAGAAPQPALPSWLDGVLSGMAER